MTADAPLEPGPSEHPDLRDPGTLPPVPDPSPMVSVAVDVVVLTVHDGRLEVLLVERGFPPYRSAWNLPGGFVRLDEDLDTAASRELREGTGLTLERAHLEQFRAYGDPGRDPRRRVVTIAYLALVNDPPEPTGGKDALDARFWPVKVASTKRGPNLAFDHLTIVQDAVRGLQSRIESTTIAPAFLPEQFTIPQLRAIYEAVWGRTLHPANFRRKVLSVPGFVVPVPKKRAATTGRPAQLYRRGRAEALHPPINRTTRRRT